MDMQRFLAALEEALGSTQDRIETMVKARNAPLEKRVAGIVVLATTHPTIGVAVTELIQDLLEPGWDQNSAPTATEMGQRIVRLANTPPGDRPKRGGLPVGEETALVLLELAEGRADVPNESLDLVLKATTGRDAMWWIEWIRARRRR